MTKCKLFALPVCLAMALLVASVSYGQTPITPSIVAVGSSGVFNAMAVAAATADPITGAGAPCGSASGSDGLVHVWTQGGGKTTVAGIDGRSAGIPAEPGSIWVVWAQTSSGQPLVVCAYLTVDSIVGDRLFFSQHTSTVNGAQSNGTLLLNPGSAGGACKVPLLQDDGATCNTNPITAGNALPAVIQQSLNGFAFNAVFTDIRPEDAQFANGRAQCSPANSAVTCMGYGPTPVGTAIQSSYSLTGGVQTSAQVVQFNVLPGFQDPISLYIIPNNKTIGIGADPVMIFVNNSDTSAGGFGTLYGSGGNTQSHTLALVFSGLLGLTTDVTGSLGISGQPLKVIIREPTSGTYNTFEWQVPRAKGTDFAQETNLAFSPGVAGNDCTSSFTPSPASATYALPPASNLGCVDPLYRSGPNGSSRTRAIGGSEMVKAVNANPGSPAVNPDSIGYNFWSFSNFTNTGEVAYPNLRYLTVDGVDPLGVPGGYNGKLPICTGFANLGTLSCPAITLANVKNGAYRIWNVIHADTYTTLPNSNFLSPAAVPALIQATQDQSVSTVSDFVPLIFCSNASCSSTSTGLPVFRSHYFVSGANQANGTNGEAEAGGDMLGAIFNRQSDIDFLTNTGTEIFEFLQ
jgi:hypothetical protein